MRNRFLLGTAIFFVVCLTLMKLFPDEVAEFNLQTAAARRVSLICHAYQEGFVSREQLCATPVPKIKYFQPFLRRYRVQDGDWYAARGWKYYPEVRCSEEGMRVFFMDLSFRCEDGDPVLLSGLTS